jgi:hypothetical protein
MVAGSKRVRRREGDILRIDLGDGSHSYAQVAEEPLIIFFDGRFTEEQPLERVSRLPVLFRLTVMNYAVTRGIWPVIGHHPLAADNAEEPFFYQQDAISGRLALYHSSFSDTNYERPASLAECEGLECAAVWEPEHVEDRLRDYYNGRPNEWVESLKIDVSAIPPS